MTLKRTACALSACGLLAIAGYEGFSLTAYEPIEGDVPTIGFGSTQGVKAGDTITVPQALERLYRDTGRSDNAIAQCVKVPLSQGEWDAFSSLAFNIGKTAFCNSTLVRKLNEGDYEGACREIPRWCYSKGKKIQGLVNRRAKEMEQCLKH